MHGDLEPEEHHWGDETHHVNDLWEDMDRLNSLYEELMWGNDDVLEFVPDYKNCLLYTSPSPRDGLLSRMPSSA